MNQTNLRINFLLSTISVVFLLAISSNTNAQAVDTSILSNKLDTLTKTTKNIENIQQYINDLAKDSIAIRRKIESLEEQEKATKTELKELKYERNKASEIARKLKSGNDSLANEKLKLESDIIGLKTEAHKLDSIKKDYIRDTLALKEKKDELIKDTSKLQSAKAAFAIDIKKQEAFIASQKDSLEVIAEIKMIDSVRHEDVINFPNLPTRFIQVKEVHIKVKEGIMLEITVKTDIGVFRNKSAVIDLVHFGERGTDRLYLENQKFSSSAKRSASYIEIKNIIHYDPLRSYSDLPYSEFDITLFPTDDKRTYLLRESTSINAYFNIAAFTDIKGISGEPNGIAQFTADAKFIMRTKNIRNSSTVFFNYISFQGGFSKFDNDFKGSALFQNDSASRKDLLQRSHYSVGLKANLLRCFESPLPRHLFDDIQLNVGMNFLGARVYDTAFKDQAKTIIDTSFRTITQNQFYIEPIATLSRHKNLSMRIALPFYLNSLKKSSGVRNSGSEYWVCPSLILMYYSKRDASGKLFFRYNHFINLKQKQEAFSQIQLGYSVNLTDALGVSK